MAVKRAIGLVRIMARVTYWTSPRSDLRSRVGTGSVAATAALYRSAPAAASGATRVIEWRRLSSPSSPASVPRSASTARG